ncbi:MAG TPA: serine hydrolase domain-containing protein [Candidatus Dormibacteraeota bacterium]|nr:serine hydrolase domain-containing protein [Candidatus Dormibacteraeota bacterium]
MDPARAGFDPVRLARIDRHLERYVDDGRLPGWLLLVSRGGAVVHVGVHGQRDREAALPVETDTLFRIYSMTKPITSVAAMMLYEEGAFELTTPVSQFIPSFEHVRVYRRGSALRPATVPAGEPVRIWHLLTHTAGLSYGFHHAHAVDEAYRAAGYEWGQPPGTDLQSACDTWAGLPLLFEPGTEWNYSHATDVLGRVCEVASGLPLDRLFGERIFEPLGMTDTGFWVREEQSERLAALYTVAPGSTQAVRNDAMGARAHGRPLFLSGGGGLVSTAGDYHRFARMLLRRGELGEARLLGPRTVALMTRNHLPGGADLEAVGRPLFAETTFAGVGFGLGFSVVLDAVAGKSLGNAGEFGWGGAASTVFWVDPVDEVIVVFMTQLLPSSTYPIRSELRQLVYQALVGGPG